MPGEGQLTSSLSNSFTSVFPRAFSMDERAFRTLRAEAGRDKSIASMRFLRNLSDWLHFLSHQTIVMSSKVAGIVFGGLGISYGAYYLSQSGEIAKVCRCAAYIRS